MTHALLGSMTATRPARRQRGFSLVEIAVVLVITGLALGTGLALLNARMAQAKVDTTKTRVEAIRQAMTIFVSQNYRLPCPAAPGLTRGLANYNIEQVTGASGSQICTAASGLTNNINGTTPLGVSRGTVPCVTLGLSEDTCTDGWSSRFTYFVQNSAIRMTVNNVSGMQGTMTVHKITPSAAATTTLGLSPTGNQINACSTTAGDNNCNLAAVAMVISHGANRGGGFMPVSATAVPSAGGAISTYELENTDNNIRFIQNDYIEQGVNAFDDVVLPITPRDVVFSLSQLGVVKLPAAFMAERFDLVKQTLLQSAYANALPASTPRTLQLPAESGTAAAYTFLAANFPGCALPTTTLVLPLPAVVPALGAGGGILNDAWGNPIRYRRVTNSVAQGDACSVPLLLLSYGPDGVPSADDLAHYITKQDVNAFISKYGGW